VIATHNRLFSRGCDPAITGKVRLNHKKCESKMGNREFDEKLPKNNVYAYLTNKFDIQLANT
jgi:hypothetical protein